jgi:ATP/maltotriose-dependent transcriptional regulator MalT
MLAQAAHEEPLLGAEFCLYTDNDFALAATQWGYGNFLINRGEVAQATALITDSLHRFRKRGNQSFVADCLASLGRLELIKGDIAGAHTIYQEVVTIATDHNLLEVLAESQSLLGIVTLYAGNAAKARLLLEECLRFCLEVKNTDYLARVCMYLAEMALWEGEPDQAAHWLGQSLTYGAARKRITMNELQRLFVTARLATMQGQYQLAAILFGLIEAEHRRIYYVYRGPMLPLANVALKRVREELGVELFDKAFAVGQHLPLAEAYDTMLTQVVTL